MQITLKDFNKIVDAIGFQIEELDNTINTYKKYLNSLNMYRCKNSKIIADIFLESINIMEVYKDKLLNEVLPKVKVAYEHLKRYENQGHK